MTHREFVDSREGFSLSEQIAYFENVEVEPTQADLDRAEEYLPSEEDYAEMDAMFEAMDRQDELDDDEDYDEDYDGQPDEYTEWQDLYGGDDWDQGQYDEY